MIIQVAPPGQGGVFDYQQCLSEQWNASGTGSHVIALSKDVAIERSLDDRMADCFMRSGRPGHGEVCSVVLHFSGYGYGNRGLCFWLLKELRAVRARRAGLLHLVIVFHELYAVGPPWRSAFWVCGAQAWIARRLARMADAVWTNTDKHAGWLRGAVRSDTPLHVRPVFSNVGEAAAPPPLHTRNPCVVVFGSAPTRQRAIAALADVMAPLSALGVEEVIEVGSGTACAPSGLLPLPTRHLGRLSAEELGALLKSSRYALLDYEAHGLAKSGVFAAYAAHGCLALNTSEQLGEGDALKPGRDYIALRSLAGLDLSAAGLQAVATRLHHWYHDHSLQHQARELLVLAGATSTD